MTTARRVHYPESDGKPMGETELHVRELLRLLATLSDHFADDADVYVGGDLILYYEEGNPRRFVIPDVFVALGASKEPYRRIYQLWEERVPPTFVIEITSRSTRATDEKRKPDVYAQLGVHEYFLYDPRAEYLHPPLQGMRLDGNTYSPIAQEADSSFASTALRLRLQLVNGRLRLFDAVTGAPLLDPSESRDLARQQAEAAQHQLEIANQRADAEAAARYLLEQRIAELEARWREGDNR